MEWDDDVQGIADKSGFLVYAMSQGQTAVVTQPGPWGSAYSGYCNGCAVIWMALRYAGEDFAYDPKSCECLMPDWRTTRLQNIYDAEDGEWPDKLTVVLSRHGLSVNRGRLTIQNGVATGTMLMNAGLAAKGCYYVSLRRPGGGHAVAMQNMGPSGWRFFDANFGCFHVRKSGEFWEFMDWYLEATGYDETYTEMTRIVGINPPPFVTPAFGSSVKDLVKKFGG